MIEKIEKWRVGDETFDTEDEAILFETSNILGDMLQGADVLAVSHLLALIKTNKDIWEAMANYCAALDSVHNPPKTFARIFGVGEVSSAFPMETISGLDPNADPQPFRVHSIGDDTP